MRGDCFAARLKGQKGHPVEGVQDLDIVGLVGPRASRRPHSKASIDAKALASTNSIASRSSTGSSQIVALIYRRSTRMLATNTGG